jgi:hypothetical protein
MKQRYNQNFLFPQGAEDFGRSLVFPQGNLHGLASTTEQANLTYAFLFPQGETQDYGRALMFPQGQLHGLGRYPSPSVLTAEIARAQAEAQRIADQIASMQSGIYQSQVNTLTLQQATDFLKSTGYYQTGMTAESIAATAHAISPDVYVSGAGSGYGTVGTEANTGIIGSIDQLNADYQNQLLIIRQAQDMMASAIAQDQADAIDQARQISERKAQLEAESRRVAAETAASAAAAAAAAAAATNAATVTTPRTITAVAPPPAPVTNFTYTVDFHDNQFWLTRSDGAPIQNGSADFKSAALFVAPQNIALTSVSVTPAANAKFAANNSTVAITPVVATSTGVVSNSVGSTFGQTITTTTNQTTGTTTVKNTATGVTATTTPATGTTTVVATSSDTGKLALYALLGVLLLRGAVR